MCRPTLGINEQNCIKDTVRNSLKIMMSLPTELFVANLNVLSTIFGQEDDLLFYKGQRFQFQMYEGFAIFRAEMARSFAESYRGFDLLLDRLFRVEDKKWLGADKMYNFLRALSDVSFIIFIHPFAVSSLFSTYLHLRYFVPSGVRDRREEDARRLHCRVHVEL